MAEQKGAGMELDVAQVRKAVQALFACLKSSKEGSQSLLLNEHQYISLLVTLWKIPPKERTIHIPLPHGIRTSNAEVCLFTRDEPQMTSEQTEKFIKKLLAEHGVKNITQVIPYQALKKEYKPFEAKRKLLRSFDLFLADDRIRRLLPSQIGKHFYRSKKEPLSVNLKGKQLAKQLDRVIQGTTLPVSRKGCCCMARVAHSGMTVDEAVENISAAFNTIAEKLSQKGKNIKVLHLKTQNSVALPIYCSNLRNLSELDKEANAPDMKQNTGKKGKGKKSKKKKARKPKDQAKEPVNGSAAGEPEEKPEEPKLEVEEIPELVPMETPAKKAKVQKTPKSRKTPAKEPVEKSAKSPEAIRETRLRKKLAQTPVAALVLPETPKAMKKEALQTPSRKAKTLKTPKPAVTENGSAPEELERTPRKRAGPAKVKLAKSAKKVPRTPKRKLESSNVPQSC
ncbi:ribosomal L1 domain-containing protein 1-like isoform X2 [Acipenser oxyrinchus oxyrinchus]|uniref:Ribosomal L1 domain-containing protein 1 n=1 Tax=Acipenser oxyrinchus oxyrinchus TaxID=40147 RepID=A0AAD8D5G5_ACIOX|nr:ribosomal L1 domain-containing protein 1-like isoform X2 [Acipenser oxyrinchus oxyrinchus]